MNASLTRLTDLGIVERILARFSETATVSGIEPKRSSGGFSGAEFWRITSFHGIYCLRRWPPEHPNERRLAAIHQVLRQVFTRGITQVSAPKADRSGHTIIIEAGSLWELTPWMPGIADFRKSPSPKKLAAALQILARFHFAAADIQANFGVSTVGITSRTVQLKKLLATDFNRLESQFRIASVRGFPDFQSRSGKLDDSSAAHAIAQSCSEFLESFLKVAPRILSQLQQISATSISTQPCIRDIWSDHVLFTGDVVTGVVDFGAMRRDHIAADISRLLGSLVGDDPAGWSDGITAYEQIRNLTPADRQLITLYDRSGVLLSAMNWVQWIYAENRQFEDWHRVQERCSEIAKRLRHLKQQL